MNKRLRRKKHKGEFQEMGFKLEVEADKHTDEQWEYDLLDAIEKAGLNVGGGFRSCYITSGSTKPRRHHGHTVTPGQLEEIRHWLEQDRRVTRFHFGRQTDAWYGPWED